MKTLIQRVSRASISINGKIIAQIQKGLLVLFGVMVSDTEKEAEWLAEKLVNLRVFPAGEQEFDKSVLEIAGEILIVSQFTLYGNCNKGRRPDFNNAARPEKAEPIYEKFIDFVRQKGVKVEHGQFGADMKVSLTNDGPATFIIEKQSTNPEV